MDFQDRVIAMTRRALDDFFHAARAVPEDRRDWKPLEAGRSVIEQAMEVAFTPMSFAVALQTRVFPPPFDEAAASAMDGQMKSCQSLGDWEAACRDNSEALFAAIRALSDEDLDTTLPLAHRIPFTRDRTCSLAEMALFHHDNTVYHTGQVNYIQTLYGDTAM